MNQYNVNIACRRIDCKLAVFPTFFLTYFFSLSCSYCVSNDKVFAINFIPNEDVNIKEVKSNPFGKHFPYLGIRIDRKFSISAESLKHLNSAIDSTVKYFNFTLVFTLCHHQSEGCILCVYWIKCLISHPLYVTIRWLDASIFHFVPIIKTSIFDKQTSGKQQVSKTVKIETHKSSSATLLLSTNQPNIVLQRKRESEKKALWNFYGFSHPKSSESKLYTTLALHSRTHTHTNHS